MDPHEKQWTGDHAKDTQNTSKLYTGRSKKAHEALHQIGTPTFNLLKLAGHQLELN